MANENLEDALRSAGLTSEQFAQVIDVDPQTVQRWVSGALRIRDIVRPSTAH
jgi:DNA-binding transcriptional regulator YiaG